MSDCCNEFEFTSPQGTFYMDGGIRGKDGVTFYPHVSAAGILSWTNDGGKQNPDPVNIKGADGMSAYAAAQQAGFTGTEAQFNAYLSGIGTLTEDVDDLKSAIKNNSDFLEWYQGNLRTATPHLIDSPYIIYSNPVAVLPNDVIEYQFPDSDNKTLRIVFLTDETTNSVIGWSDTLTASGRYALGATTNTRYVRFRIASTNNTAITPDKGNILLATHLFGETDTLESTGDGTAVGSIIVSVLRRYKKCHLGIGTFTVGTVTMPDGSCLSGSGPATELALGESYTGNLYAVKMGSNCIVRDMSIVGGSSPIELNSTVSRRHAIGWIGNYGTSGNKDVQPKYGTISNCIIHGFSGGAITCDNTGPAVEHGLNVCNVQIYNCNAGINIAYYSEFHRFTNVLVYECYYACVNNGGNNVFTNCGFSNNKVGFIAAMVDGSGRTKTNSLHGSAIGCVFNHINRDDTTLGKGDAVKIVGVSGSSNSDADNGFVFDGCQFFYGGISLENAARIIFSNCLFGSNRTDASSYVGYPITLKNTDTVNRKMFLLSSIFSRQPAIAITNTGTGAISIINNGSYTANGTPIETS